MEVPAISNSFCSQPLFPTVGQPFTALICISISHGPSTASLLINTAEMLGDRRAWAFMSECPAEKFSFVWPRVILNKPCHFIKSLIFSKETDKRTGFEDRKIFSTTIWKEVTVRQVLASSLR